MNQQDPRCAVFRHLHTNGCFTMPNAWDGGSAKLLQDAGFSALGTTSAGLAYSRGKKDAVANLSLQDTLDNVADIVASVEIPVSADFENGFAHGPDEVARNVLACVETGAAGCCIEDWSGDKAIGSYARGLAVERIAAVTEAAHHMKPDFMVCARSDLLLSQGPDSLPEAVERARLFEQAGADCVYVPGIRGRDQLALLLSAVDCPVNVLVGVTGLDVAADELAAMGVRRLSLGGSLMRYTLAALVTAAKAIGSGDFSYVDQAIPDAGLPRTFQD